MGHAGAMERASAGAASFRNRLALAGRAGYVLELAPAAGRRPPQKASAEVMEHASTGAASFRKKLALAGMAEFVLK